MDRRLGFGVTPYFTIRSQSDEERLFAQALSDSGQIALLQVTDTYEASHYGLVVKAGLGLDLSPLTMGITVTTPKIRIAGTGSAILNETQVQLDPDGDGIRTNSFESDLQREVTANHESPLSVAAGAAYRWQDTMLHASVEWFDSIDPYAVLELQPFVSQATGATLQRSLTDAGESIVNWGLGAERRLSERAKAYVSYVTDSSSRDARSDVAVTGFDVRHVAGGATFAIRRSEFTVGIAYAWGDEEVGQEIDLEPGSDGTIVDPGTKSTLAYRRITFVLGFSVEL